MNKSGPLLVIEDDIDDQELLREIFSNLNYRNKVMFFNDGNEAFQYLVTTDVMPFLVLSDINMPKMNGFELYNRLKKLDSNVKICFMTIGSEIFLREFAKEAFPEFDLNCFIRKPIANEDLLKRVQEVLELE